MSLAKLPKEPQCKVRLLLGVQPCHQLLHEVRMFSGMVWWWSVLALCLSSAKRLPSMHILALRAHEVENCDYSPKGCDLEVLPPQNPGKLCLELSGIRLSEPHPSQCL